MKFQHLSYSLALPPAAAKIQAAGQCHKTAVYGFGKPADRYVTFQYSDYYYAEYQVDGQGKGFEQEGGPGVSCASDRLKEY